jgi:signal transduction histidine kinase
MIQRLKQSFTAITDSKNIQLNFSFDPVFELSLNTQTRKNMYLICKEAMNNAIKYASCRKIAVNLKMAANVLEMDITDDGIGFDTKLPGLGNGLNNMRARAVEMKAVLQIKSGSGGTEVSLRRNIPRIRQFRIFRFKLSSRGHDY